MRWEVSQIWEAAQINAKKRKWAADEAAHAQITETSNPSSVIIGTIGFVA